MPPVSSRTISRSMPRSAVSFFKGQASARAGRRAAGRRLAYSPRSLRMDSRAVSGRLSASEA